MGQIEEKLQQCSNLTTMLLYLIIMLTKFPKSLAEIV